MSIFKKAVLFTLALLLAAAAPVWSDPTANKETSGQEDKLPWWPTDARPAPVRDEARGGFWWWPTEPGTQKELWGNRGYAYVNKIIYNWRGGGSHKNVKVTINDVGLVETEPQQSLLVKRTVRELKIYFKGDNAAVESSHMPALKKALATLKHDPVTHILISGNVAEGDAPDLGERRAAAVEKFMLDGGIPAERIKILAAGKFQESGFFTKKQKGAGAVDILVVEIKEVVIPGPKN